MISFGPTEEQELIRQTVHEFAESELRELARSCDEKRELPDELLQKSWELGLVAGSANCFVFEHVIPPRPSKDLGVQRRGRGGPG